MTVFVCEPGYEGILSCIYDAGMSKIPQDELRLEIKNSGQNVEPFFILCRVRSIIGKSKKGDGNCTQAFKFPDPGAAVCGLS